MNSALAKNNDLYLRLLLSEWFYVASQTRRKQCEIAKQEIQKLKDSLESKRPKRENDILETHALFPTFRFILLLLSLPAGAAIGYLLGWVAFNDNTILEKILCCLIGAVPIVLALIYFGTGMSKYLEDKKHNKNAKETNKNNKAAFERATVAYEKAKEKYQAEVAPIRERLDSLNKDYQLLDKAYLRSLDFIYPKYQNIVCVCQFTQYIESGRCTAFDGPHGCYNLFEEELRTNLIINKLDIIISRLDTIIDNQREMSNILRSIDSSVKSIEKDVKEMKMFESIIALASVQTASRISDVNQSIQDLNHTANEFDMYYRRYH